MDGSVPGKKLRVGICGGGIGGLILANALSRYPDIEVTIYEAASKLAEAGAGVVLYSRPWEIIRELGLEDELSPIADRERQEGPFCMWAFRKGDCSEEFESYQIITQGNSMLFHRSDFQQAILKCLASECKILCGKRLRSYTQQPSEPISLLFEDESTATCDILIGADGLKSAVRKTLMYEQAHIAQMEGRRIEINDYLACVEPVWSGDVAYRALISTDLLRARYPNHRIFTEQIQYIGKDAHVIAFPISKRGVINFVATISRHDQENTTFDGPWVAVASKEEVISKLAGWNPEVQALLECIDEPLRWAMHTVRPLSTFVHGRVAIMGDAAHAMLPHQGAGAGQAIEDAFILSTLLGNPKTDGSTASIQRALKIFDLVRRPRALEVQEKSRVNSKYLTLMYPGIDFSNIQGQELHGEFLRLMDTVKQNWEWAWLSSPMDAYDQALKLLDLD